MAGDSRLTAAEWEASDLQQLDEILETLDKLQEGVDKGYLNPGHATTLATPLLTRQKRLEERYNKPHTVTSFENSQANVVQTAYAAGSA